MFSRKECLAVARLLKNTVEERLAAHPTTVSFHVTSKVRPQGEGPLWAAATVTVRPPASSYRVLELSFDDRSMTVTCWEYNSGANDRFTCNLNDADSLARVAEHVLRVCLDSPYAAAVSDKAREIVGSIMKENA